ncbi:MAG: hypothetical protein J5806_11915 [Lentisphaeria bacterium]|nr:hypothetical protein [Lentisphaeria bacterium]
MSKQIRIAACLLGVVLLASGCMNQRPPEDTSAGLNGLQQRALTIRNIGEDLDATYNDVWYSVISTLQLNGFILKQADKNSGFIYGVWQNRYEQDTEYTQGGLILTQLGVTSPSWYGGAFFSRTTTYKQIDVSVTLEPLARTQTLVRLVSRFDNEGVPTAHGVFASRFFGLLRKEIFLRKNNGSIYQKYSVANKK